MRSTVNTISIISMAFLSACDIASGVKDVFREPMELKDFTIIGPVDANDGFPIPLDVIMVYDEDILEVFAEIPTQTWFEQKSFLIPSNSGRFELISYEIPMGLSTDKVTFNWDERRNIKGVFLFANLVEGQNNKLRVETESINLVTFDKSGIKVILNDRD